MLKSIMRKIAAIKEKVQKGAKYDKKNLADEVRERSPLAKSVVDRTARIMFQQILRTDVAIQPEDYDTNQQSSLEVGALNFVSKEENPASNLITLSIIKDASVVASVDEEQTIEFDAVPDAGLWSISLYSESTSDLAFNANAAAVQSALRLINGLEDVTVTGDYTAGFTVVFAGASSGIDHPLLVEETNTLEAAAVPVVITITETVAGVPGVDTRSVIVDGSDIKVHCIAAATNAEVETQIEASAPASALISVSVDAGQDAVAATAILNAPFTGAIG